MKKALAIVACSAALFSTPVQNVEVGFVNTNGSSKTTNLDAKYTLKNSFDAINYTFDLGAYSSKSSGSTSAEKYFANLNLEEELSNGWLGYTNLGWSKDRFKGFKNRYTAGVGAGKTLFADATQKLDVKLGLSYNHDHYTAGSSSTYGALNEALNYTNKLSETSDLYASVSSFQKLDDFGDYEIKSVLGVKYRLSTQLSLNAEIDVDYYSEPSGSTDTKTLVKLSYDF